MDWSEQLCDNNYGFWPLLRDDGLDWTIMSLCFRVFVDGQWTALDRVFSPFISASLDENMVCVCVCACVRARARACVCDMMCFRAFLDGKCVDLDKFIAMFFPAFVNDEWISSGGLLTAGKFPG